MESLGIGIPALCFEPGGQAEVMRDGKYLPLTADVVNAQLKKLEAVTK